MTVDNVNVEDTVKRVTALIAEEKSLSPALRSSLEVLLLLVSILINRLGLIQIRFQVEPNSGMVMAWPDHEKLMKSW